jgi:hypothetical protein
MLSRERPCTHSVQNRIGSSEPAVAKIMPRPEVSDNLLAYASDQAGPNSSRTQHHSLFRRKLPCSGNKNSLFGHAREFVRKSFILLRDRTTAIAKMAHNL